MRIYLLTKNEPQEYYIYIKYEGTEWASLKALYESHGVSVARTDHGFGFTRLNYYRYANADDTLFRYAEESGNAAELRAISAVDDINREAIVEGKLNLAIFRVVPGKTGLIHIRIPRMIHIAEEKQYSVAIIKAYNLLFNTPAVVEIHIIGSRE